MFYTETVTIDSRSFAQKLYTGFQKWCEVVGYSRAAAHLASLGYHEEAKHCMMQIAKLKS
jgi:ferritin